MVEDNKQPEVLHPTLTEYSFIRCKSCNRNCTRWLSGYYPNGRDKKWVDAQDRIFNGKRCPDCHNKRINSEQKRERHNLKEQRKRDRMSRYLGDK